jgi:hypothetical protein
MTIETIAFLGFVFAATTLAAMAYERRMDVLYGPYLEGRTTILRLIKERFFRLGKKGTASSPNTGNIAMGLEGN